MVVQLFIHGQHEVGTRPVCSQHMASMKSVCGLHAVNAWLAYGLHTPARVQCLVELNPARLEGSLQVARSGFKARALMRFSAGGAPWG